MKNTIRALILSASLFNPNVSLAAPPPVDSEDYEALSPFADWLKDQYTVMEPTVKCCDLSDCRMVAMKVKDGHYEALITEKDDRGLPKFESGVNRWVIVPNEVIKREQNPTGFPIACWTMKHYKATKDGYFYCFFLPNLG